MSRKTYPQSLLDIVDDYASEHGNEIIDPAAVIRWAITTGRYTKPPKSMQKQGELELRQALRRAKHLDPQGRAVRTNHAVTLDVAGEQIALWATIYKATPEHMKLSLQQRRQGMVADVKRHKDDTESYNENNQHNAEIPIFSYNFELDLEEAELPTSYDENEMDFDEGDLDDEE